MKNLKSYNEYHKVNEGWIHNLITAISLASGVSTQNIMASQNTSPIKVEQSIGIDRVNFFSACLQFVCELDTDSDIYKMAAMTEAKLYFQSMRDGIKPVKLSKEGEVVVKSVEIVINQMDLKKVEVLATKGKTAQVSSEIVGL